MSFPLQVSSVKFHTYTSKSHIHRKHTAYHTQHTCIYIFIHVGNYTYAAVRGHETYELLRDSLSPVWRQVVELIHDPAVCIY